MEPCFSMPFLNRQAHRVYVRFGSTRGQLEHKDSKKQCFKACVKQCFEVWEIRGVVLECLAGIVVSRAYTDKNHIFQFRPDFLAN